MAGRGFRLRRIRSSRSARRIILWDLAKGYTDTDAQRHLGGAFGLLFDDARSFIPACWDETIRLWDPASGKKSRKQGPKGPVQITVRTDALIVS